MKKKIIAFFSILAVSVILCGGIFANAVEKTYAYNYASNSNFYCYTPESNANIKITADYDLGTVRALNSSDYYHYKYVEITSYHYNSDTQSFLEQEEGWNTGNSRTLTANTTITNSPNDITTNTLVIGFIGYSSISQTGWHYAGAVHVRRNNSIPYLPSSYYNYLQGYEK